MNLKSCAKKSGFNLRNTGARNLACQYKHSLNILSSYCKGGQLNRLQNSNWNCRVATGGGYHWRQVDGHSQPQYDWRKCLRASLSFWQQLGNGVTKLLQIEWLADDQIYTCEWIARRLQRIC